MKRGPAIAPRVCTVGLALVAALLGARLLIHLGRWVHQPANGFVSHYAASRVVLEGGRAALLYDDRWFSAQVARFEPTVYDLYGPNLPTLSVLLVPLAVPPYRAARLIWTLASFAMVVASIWLMARSLGLDARWTSGLLGLAFAAQPVTANLFRGQLYALGLLLVVLAWRGSRSARSWQTGASLGVLLATKSTGAPLWLWLAVRHRWRALGWGAASLAAAAVISWHRVGVDGWTAYFRTAGAWASRPGFSVTAYQTLPGFLRHLLVFDARVNPGPLTDLGGVGWLLSGGCAIAVLCTCLVMLRAEPDHDIGFGGCTLLSLICSPVSTDYHYTLALFPMAVLASRLRGAMLGRDGLAFLLGVLLIAADLPYRSPRLGSGAWALLAYPKLYGGLILLGLLLRRRGASGGPAPVMNPQVAA